MAGHRNRDGHVAGDIGKNALHRELRHAEEECSEGKCNKASEHECGPVVPSMPHPAGSVRSGSAFFGEEPGLKDFCEVYLIFSQERKALHPLFSVLPEVHLMDSAAVIIENFGLLLPNSFFYRLREQKSFFISAYSIKNVMPGLCFLFCRRYILGILPP